MSTTTVSKFIFPFSFLLLAAFLLPHPTASGQTVKTYSTGDLFGKKKKKKAASNQDNNIHSGTCLSAETNGTKLYQDLYRAEGHLVNIVSQDAIFLNSIAQLGSTLKDARYRFKSVAPIGKEIDSLHIVYQTCQEKGMKTLPSNVMDWLLGTKDAYSKLITSSLSEMEASVLRARKHMGMEVGIFADEAGDSDASAARKEIANGRQALQALTTICQEFSGLLALHQAGLDGIESQYQEVEAAMKQEKEGHYVNAYHREHLNTLAFGKQTINAGTIAGQLSSTFTPQDDLFAAIFLEKPLREFVYKEGVITQPSVYLEFSIGDQVITKMKVGSSPDAFLPFRLLGQTPKTQQEKGLISLANRKDLMGTLARLTPRIHTVLVQLAVGGQSIASGKFQLDCSGGDHQSHYQQLLTDLDADKKNSRREEYWNLMSYKNNFPVSKTRASITKRLVEAGAGKIKRAKVFIKDDRWTAVVNEMGTAHYRQLYYFYVLEAQDGTFYVGHNSVGETALLGGGFETDLTPTFSPLDQKAGALKDLWEKNNSGTLVFQVKIKDDIALQYID